MVRDPIRYEATPYVSERHGAFVCTSWCRGSGQRADVLERRLAGPDARCLVAHQVGKPDQLLGWAATAISAGRWAVVWAYTRELFGRVRRRGLMTSLLLDLGVDPAQPTPCLFWSPDAAAIAARGYGFIYAPRGLTKEAA